jgi:hypothetical protein
MRCGLDCDGNAGLVHWYGMNDVVGIGVKDQGTWRRSEKCLLILSKAAREAAVSSRGVASRASASIPTKGSRITWLFPV